MPSTGDVLRRDETENSAAQAIAPDELRKLADLLERPTKDGARLAREGMRAAADAWEADQELCRRELRMADERYDGLRKRLEAAEKITVWDVGFDIKQRLVVAEKQLEVAKRELAGIALVSDGPHHLMVFDWVSKMRFIHQKAKDAVAALAGEEP